METSYLASTPPVVTRRKFEFNLEALRGFVALIVVFHHALFHSFSLDPAYSITSKWKPELPGHSGVLIFFILSGYVIGLTNTQRLTRATIGIYLRKRLLRLYPIYLICLLFTLLVALHHYGVGTYLAHALFLQNLVVPYLYENNPLWSLNNEVLYYLAFIPISCFGLRPGRAVLVSLALGILFNTVWMQPLLSSYSIGFGFWCSGLWLSQTKLFKPQNSSYLELIALLFLFLGYQALNPFQLAIVVLCEKIHVTLPSQLVYLTDIAQLPFCFYMFLRFTNHVSRGSRLFSLAVIVTGGFFYYHTVAKYGFSSTQGAGLLFPMLFFSIGAVVLALAYAQSAPQTPVVLPDVFLKLGAISYGIYVIHFPVSIMLSRFTVFSGSALTFVVRLAIDIALVIGLGYFLELRFQPWIRAKFSS